ncbi:GntR family transcriptional regulator [Streptomyces sp. NPDC054796]
MSASEWVSASTPYLGPRDKGAGDAWGAETAAAGRRGRQRVVSAGEVVPPPGIGELLGVPEGQEAVVRRRVMYLDDLPNELTDTYYPVHLARGTPLARTTKIRGGAVTLLAEMGYVGVRVVEDVTARMPTDAEREVLDIGAATPVLQLTRVTLDADDRPFQVDRMTMPSGRQRLRYELRIG